MESLILGTHLQLAVQETCRFFMQIFKDDDVKDLPNYDIIYHNYPDDSRIKIFSYIISVAIDVFCSLPSKYFAKFVNQKIGSWRALVVKTCQIHAADIHHLPMEIDIFAARNKLVIDCLIFDWPFCNSILSQLLEYLSESFHDSLNIAQPFLDEYLRKFKKKFRKKEGLKLMSNAMKWLHVCKRSPSADKTKEVMKEYILNILASSDILMENKLGQFDDVYLEIAVEFDSISDYPRNRVDSFLFYCRICPIIQELTDFLRHMYSSADVVVDNGKIISQISNFEQLFESKEMFSIDLSNAILTALNTVLTPALYKKQKSFPKKFENNFKMFINSLVNEENCVNKALILSELNYWIERFRRKRVEMPINIDEYCPEFVNNLLSESAFIDNLQEYFVRVLLNETIHSVPSVINPEDCRIIKDVKQLQKILLNAIKTVATNLADDDPYFPPITHYQARLLYEISEKYADNFDMELQEHFEEKVIRNIEKFNESLMKLKDEGNEDAGIDDKSSIIPLIDDFEYKKFVCLIWRFVNQNSAHGLFQNMATDDYLRDLRHDIESQLMKYSKVDVDRIISRLIFFVGWRFKLRFEEIMVHEVFRFQIVFFSIVKNISVGELFNKTMKTWTLSLQSYDPLKYDMTFDTDDSIPFDLDDFFAVSKMDVVKNRMIDILRGVKSLSSSSIKVSTFPKHKRGLESTKALVHCVRQAFSRLNEIGREKSDNPNNYLNNVVVLETDIPTICNQLEADVDQLNGEISFMISIIKNSIKDPEILSKFEANYSKLNCESPKRKKQLKSESYDMDCDENNRYSEQGWSKKETKQEMRDDDFNQLMDYDMIDEDNDRHENVTSLHSKVNFINFLDPSSVHINFGDMIESRISYSTEPNSRTICIDQGRGKARPARFVEISSCPNRNPITITNKPKICEKRNRTGNSNKEAATPLYNFKVIREIGNGAYGKICEAIDKFTNRRVALKRISLNRYTDEGIPQSILRETTILRSVEHKNIIEFIDVVVDDLETLKSQISDTEMVVPKSFCFAFEYVEHDLQGLMKSKTMIFSFEQIGFLTRQLFTALQYLHDANIIHRDVTPSNIFITNRGILKLGDFGNARFLFQDITVNKTVQLTPKSVPLFYRAPEQLLEMESYGTEVDLWSAGCVIYEVLTCEFLFRFDTDTALIEMIEEIARVCGSPNQSLWSNITQSKYYIDLDKTGIAVNYSRKIDDIMTSVPYEAADVLKQIFQWDPSKRLKAKEALESRWLRDINMTCIKSEEFPDKDCHLYLLEHGDVAPASLSESRYQRNAEYNTQTNNDTTNNGIVAQMETTANSTPPQDTPEQKEEMKKFVQNLSGRILELSEVLDKLRKEPPYSPEIVRGIIMHAARKWSKTEPQRVKLVEFMLNYLLTDQEKDSLHF